MFYFVGTLHRSHWTRARFLARLQALAFGSDIELATEERDYQSQGCSEGERRQIL